MPATKEKPTTIAAHNASSGIDVVKAYLGAFERRDIGYAKSLLADDFSMTFPGPARFTQIEDVVEWRRNRYRFASKTFDGFDEAAGDGVTIVYCYGTLAGEWTDGSPFSGIRFVDRFTVIDGKLKDQRVWNDLAEALIETE